MDKINKLLGSSISAKYIEMPAPTSFPPYAPALIPFSYKAEMDSLEIPSASPDLSFQFSSTSLPASSRSRVKEALHDLREVEVGFDYNGSSIIYVGD